ENPFLDFVRRLRDGDEEAVTELVRRYEDTIRRVVRFHFDSILNPVIDSQDISQAVFLSVVLRLRLGEYTFDTPEQLRNLLLAMARNRLTKKKRKDPAACRDRQRVEAAPVEGRDDVQAPGPDPSQPLELRELMEKAQELLTAEERQLMELRREELSWAAI